MRGRPKKRIINQEKVLGFLKDIGFQCISITQEWRHVTVFGIYKKRSAVFKLASTQKTGKMTQNEFYWNEAIHSVPQIEHLNFIVPHNFSSGFYEKLFFFIAERFKKQIIERNSDDTSRIARKIKQIAQASFEIRSFNIPNSSNLFKTQTSKRKKNTAGERLLKSATFWAEQVELDLSKFLTVVEQNSKRLRTSPGHGDFSPRQLYDVDRAIGVIDGEHAGISGPLYYDPAWFYIRLRIDHGAKELAKQFLIEYKKFLSKHDQEVFWDEFKPVLIQRYMGELWGARERLINRGDLEVLGEEILQNEII